MISELPMVIFTDSAFSRNWVLEMGQGDLAMARRLARAPLGQGAPRPIFASREGRLRRPELIAGGFGNPRRVPIRSRRGRDGFAGPSSSREGLGTLPGFPSQSVPRLGTVRSQVRVQLA